MKNVVVLGAGLVAKPLVDYLLDRGYELTVATRTIAKAHQLLEGHANGKAVTMDLTKDSGLGALVEQADLVISLVPYTFHVQVAKHCIKHKKHMITTSYVSPAMKDLDGEARQAGILILNEIGLDPGIDHMSAMKIIHDVQAKGGKVDSFKSYCGGLPAPEANDNPWGYKFSWSPRGVLMASSNAAKWLQDGGVVDVQSKDLFLNHWPLEVEGAGSLQAYPNRNSLGYVELYGLEGVSTMFRGTLRYPGWCEAIKQLVDIGLLTMDEKAGLGGRTYDSVMRELIGAGESESTKEAVCSYLKVQPDNNGVARMEWVGLFSDETIPEGTTNLLDGLGAILEEKLSYREGERDMIALLHQFEITKADGTKQTATSTMVDFGIPGGDSSMARTVSLPAAIATAMVLDGKINLRGVHIPVDPDVYEPVLGELEQMGITCVEKYS